MHRSVCDSILEVVHNAIEADAGSLELDIFEEGLTLAVRVADTGRGMDEETLKRATNPFYTSPGKHPGRKVGLGLPFLIQALDLAGGTFHIESTIGQGTVVTFTFDLSNVDTPPMGSVVETVVSLFCFSQNCEICFHRKYQGREYTVTRYELVEALEELESASSIHLATQYIQSLEEDLQFRGE